MMKQKANGDFVLSTGRTLSPNRDIVGLAAFGDLKVTEGYDNEILIWDVDHDNDDTDLTVEERIELADHMIARWQEFKGEVNHA